MTDAYRNASRNAVLVKDDVGKAKPTTYDLPADGHAFGRSEIPDMEGAREVTMNWAAHVPRPKPCLKGQDFKLINKMATRSKVGNAKQLAEFRRSNDFQLATPGLTTGPPPKVIPSDVIPAFAYGRKSRPSTPIHHVIQGQYAAEFEEAQDMSYAKASEERGAPGRPTKVRLTKTASAQIRLVRDQKAAQQMLENKPPPWTMKKFRNVKGKMSPAEMGRASSEPNLRRPGADSGPVRRLDDGVSTPFSVYGEM
mmetsp:Transcript_101175/g.200974  ORF Transcript_101175/g.200974 Transcript_101175/m.200974 type:complete len:253 (-) Transcript_101175:104-862(-)|eukprot:CAMPEP_0172666386 /NCGR_PEP_ID=MMETSP1074-20121228/7766_1 /TAXON_ID=2916 /ORGANISM="Ceratium fusus, Strain PA161109" /LENGTH=252 /DNA_ID=CAMNT_0013482761 /DNA_START=108 /DNA_END=866 /DNA_ORIENTATION=-